jgi:hypothetical protein
LLLPRVAKSATIDGKPITVSRWEDSTLLIEFPAKAGIQNVVVKF